MSSTFASAYNFQATGPATFPTSSVAQKRGHGPTTLDRDLFARRPKVGRAAVRGHVGNTPGVPTSSMVNLQVPTVNEKPVRGTLAGGVPPKLPCPPERKSPAIIVTPASQNSYNAVVDKIPVASRTRKPALPALEIPEQGLLKATLVQTPGVLGSPFKSPAITRVESASPQPLQVPKAFHSHKQHCRSNAMMATPPLSAVFKNKEIVRFDGKSPAQFVLFNMKKREGQTIARIFSTAFERFKHWMTGLSQRAKDATGNLRKLRGSRANSLTDSMRPWMPSANRDIEAAKDDRNVSAYQDSDMFMIHSH